MNRRHLGLLAAVLFSWACSAPVAYYKCDALTGAPEIDAKTVWDCNRGIIARVARGKRFSLREYRSAADFFAGLTGIPADTRETRQGDQPGAGVRENLAQWDSWYRDHGDALVWDPASGSVRLSVDDAP